MENLWSELDFVTLAKVFIENFPQEKYEPHWVIRALYYLLAFALMMIAIMGFTIYLWYLKDNNSSRMLNNLYGFFSFNGIYIALQKFTHLVLRDYVSETNPMMCLLDVFRVYFASLNVLIISMISAATMLKHFYPQKYLDLSEMWSNKIFGIVIMALSSGIMVWSVKTCGLCQPECILYSLVLIFKMCVTFSLLLVICVTVDSVWGFAQMFNRVKSLIFSNEVTPVIQINPVNEAQTVNFKVSTKNLTSKL